MPSFTTLTKKITEAPRIDFGDLFNESVAVFKKVWLQGFILQLISIVLSLPLIIFNFSFFIGITNFGILAKLFDGIKSCSDSL